MCSDLAAPGTPLLCLCLFDGRQRRGLMKLLMKGWAGLYERASLVLHTCTQVLYIHLEAVLPSARFESTLSNVF
jgi:hypothetical protein